jgi:hypothetical protein
LGKAKIGKEPLTFFNIFHSFFDFNKCKKKLIFKEKGWTFAMFLQIAAGQFCLLFYWLTAGI